jgi:hypothetical protein
MVSRSSHEPSILSKMLAKLTKKGNTGVVGLEAEKKK